MRRACKTCPLVLPNTNPSDQEPSSFLEWLIHLTANSSAFKSALLVIFLIKSQAEGRFWASWHYEKGHELHIECVLVTQSHCGSDSRIISANQLDWNAPGSMIEIAVESITLVVWLIWIGKPLMIFLFMCCHLCLQFLFRYLIHSYWCMLGERNNYYCSNSVLDVEILFPT